MIAGPWLVICGVRSFEWAYRIRPGKQVLGRSRDCDITINHRSVSRRHAEITLNNGVLQIVDLKSCNGTYLNGSQVARATFDVGDAISLGHVALEVLAVPRTIGTVDGDDDDATDSSPAEGPNSVDAVAELLSPTDGKVLRLILKGLPEKSVATRLKLSEQTVHWRIKRIYKSVGVHSRSELLAMLLKPHS